MADGLTDTRPSRLAPPSVAPPRLEARHISKTFGGTEAVQALSDISITVEAGSFVSIIGPSGCGKSTFFDILAGLTPPDTGRVVVDGRDVTGQVGLTGYMLQRDLLLPWRSVLDNVILGLEVGGVSRRRAREEARHWLPRFGLSGFEDRYPSALSGGMRQRAALLRTVLTGRDILLLDEPFGALDALTRAGLQEWLLDIWDSLGKTVLLVTHDVDEAIYLSDRVYVMSPRPGYLIAELDIDLPRPRSFNTVVTSGRFAHLKAHLLATLRGAERQ